MTYIIHFDREGDRSVRYGTVEEADLHVRYDPKLRVKRTTTMGIREMQQVGVDRARVWLQLTRDTFTRDRGGKGTYHRNKRFRLLDRHKHIKRMLPEDEVVIAEADERIERAREELNGLRERRAQLVAGAWRRGLKIGAEELEERADAHVKH